MFILQVPHQFTNVDASFLPAEWRRQCLCITRICLYLVYLMAFLQIVQLRIRCLVKRRRECVCVCGCTCAGRAHSFTHSVLFCCFTHKRFIAVEIYSHARLHANILKFVSQKFIVRFKRHIQPNAYRCTTGREKIQANKILCVLGVSHTPK